MEAVLRWQLRVYLRRLRPQLNGRSGECPGVASMSCRVCTTAPSSFTRRHCARIVLKMAMNGRSVECPGVAMIDVSTSHCNIAIASECDGNYPQQARGKVSRRVVALGQEDVVDDAIRTVFIASGCSTPVAHVSIACLDVFKHFIV